ncbi:hypothetical protein AGABI2DRAFT_178859 [Agaricus bisporus var. bisporus H97]|uniref:hypothetical protein n=1 Tax=Agaricus bisporus var. bisporus (strain H97 / ATCC MYA-4626 / FGSC 10389) TaxID=936046 RepID=UPI00029F585E|nr:hypothetical protein AGABI2DRAFT_178859 [Agaricus bisporus var. bisporus H97]EKV46554.1 hypothetical protein AGABI2DRAFT_178859 [Agaricus bisporus var. bisporus H97]
MVPKREAESNTDSLVDIEIKSESSDELEPMDQFFSQYSWFDYNAPLPASQQFKRLREEAGWNRGDAEGTQAWEGYRTALVRQFNSTYSSDLDDLEAWHALIRHIGVVELPNTAEECQTLIEGKYINLVDLVDARNDPTIVIEHFANEIELSEYTRANDKIFPRGHIEAGSLLTFLLRRIFRPRNPEGVRLKCEKGKVRNRKRGKKTARQDLLGKAPGPLKLNSRKPAADD